MKEIILLALTLALCQIGTLIYGRIQILSLIHVYLFYLQPMLHRAVHEVMKFTQLVVVLSHATIIKMNELAKRALKDALVKKDMLETVFVNAFYPLNVLSIVNPNKIYNSCGIIRPKEMKSWLFVMNLNI